MVLKRSLVYRLSALLLIILLFVFYSNYTDFRDFVNSEYMKFKEFLFLLNNVKGNKKPPLDEAVIRDIVKKLNLEIRRISVVSGGYEIEIKEVKGYLLPRLIKELEKYGRIKELEAIDNTGEGRFFLKLRITQS